MLKYHPVFDEVIVFIVSSFSLSSETISRNIFRLSFENSLHIEVNEEKNNEDSMCIVLCCYLLPIK